MDVVFFSNAISHSSRLEIVFLSQNFGQNW